MLELRTSGRVLLVGPGAGAFVGDRAPAAAVRSIPSAAELANAPGPWDAVVLSDALEHERWDRWLLQRVHGLLAPEGLLIVTVPNVFDIWSARGLSYLAGRAAKQLRRRLAPRGAIPAADRSAFTGRRYAPGALAAMVASVGFAVVSSEMIDPVLPGGLGLRTSRSIALTARKLPSLWGPGRPFPACEAFRASYAARHAEAMSRRDAWRRANGAASAPRDVDVADWSRRGAIVFAPHPDDEVFGCGGTLLDLAGRGGAVSIVQVTDGSDSAAFIDEPEAVRRQVRLDEAKVVAGRLAARELTCLRADNRTLRATDELRVRFRECLERSRAGLAFAPSFTDIHPDHQTVLRLLAEAMREMTGPSPEVVLYEAWSLVTPTHVHAVDARIHDIEALLLAYENALKVDDLVHLVAERLFYDSCEHRGRAGYVEAFEVLGAERFLELAATHFGARAAAARRA